MSNERTSVFLESRVDQLRLYPMGEWVHISTPTVLRCLGTQWQRCNGTADRLEARFHKRG